MQIWIIIIAFLGLFILLMSYEEKNEREKIKKWIKKGYGKKPKRKQYSTEKIKIYWDEFGDKFKEIEKIDEITWNDLEMEQVFSRINNCMCFVGEQVLYGRMHQLQQDNITLESMEDKISYYQTNDSERERVQFELNRLGKDDVNYYLPMFVRNLDMLGVSHLYFYRIMQLLLIGSVFPSIIMKEPILLMITFFVFLINAVIYSFQKSAHEVYMSTLSGIIGIIQLGKKRIKKGAQSDGIVSERLIEHAAKFERLTHIMWNFQRKKQSLMTGDLMGIVHDYLVGATMWDFIQYDKIINILKGKQDEFMELFVFVGELDMAVAIASYRASLPFYCSPEFKEIHALHMERIYHPLVNEPVCNSIEINKSCIITGSNASGKSTFIKAVAINVILAQNINTCTGKQFIMPRAGVITSMAVRDDIMAGESYYIKEVKYLKRIIDSLSLSPDRMILCVIDEILRGTNTLERIAASAAILKYLSNKNCLIIAASHDMELTGLLEQQYKCYHFCEQMKEYDILFDYKIHEGICKSKNAIKLLDFVGFPEEIVEDAKVYVQNISGNVL